MHSQNAIFSSVCRIFTFFVVIGAIGKFLPGCSDDSSNTPTPDGGVDAAPIDAYIEPDGEPPPPPPPPQDWCERFEPGPAGTREFELDLSAAHTLTRFFSTEPSEGEHCGYHYADQALAIALSGESPYQRATLDTYAQNLVSVCAYDATTTTLSPATVEMIGEVALITPGTGTVTIPSGATAVAVDLRDLPAVENLWEILVAAVSPALRWEIFRLKIGLRHHDGMIDEVMSAQNVYGSNIVINEREPIPAGTDTARPMAVLTDDRLAPAAAEMAITLRAARVAWVVGEDICTRVAESQWQPIGSGGVWVHTSTLLLDGSPAPDVIAADERLANPVSWLEHLVGAASPPPIEEDEHVRPTIADVQPFFDYHPAIINSGTVRAALVIIHGALRRFFPYFPVVGDTIDSRLLETLADASDTADGTAARNLLRRMGEAISDGHNFVYWYGSSPSAGCLPVLLESIDGEPVVARSLDPDVLPGDTILEKDGVSTVDFFDAEAERTSAASAGYRFHLMTQEFLTLSGATELTLRSPDGTIRQVTVEPSPCEDVPLHACVRDSGPLSDLGAGDVYYINLEQSVLETIEDFRSHLSAAQSSASGLILDMRGYPGVNHYEIASRLVTTTVQSMRFRTPQWTGPKDHWWQEGQYDLDPLDNPSFDGPIVLMVGPRTVSAAENFSVILIDADRVTVVGRPSAATNGNITGLQLPGGLVFTFTGMEVQHTNGAMFHGQGVIPDVEVTLDATDLADATDVELQTALDTLQNL
jgi:C-terminal processing protease CtpA/Prc